MYITWYCGIYACFYSYFWLFIYLFIIYIVSQLISSFVDKYLGYLQIFTIIKIITVISYACILCICRFTFSDKYIERDGILLNMYVFSFIRNHHTIYHGSHAIFFYSFHSGRKLSLLHILHTRPYYHIFFIWGFLF